MDNEENKLDLGAFDFVPEWAKKDAGVTVEKRSAEKTTRERSERKNFSSPRKQFTSRENFSAKRRKEREVSIDADITILPETKALGTIIRKIQSDSHAYKLKDLAYFFLDNPSSVLLKVLPKDGSKFHQCKACGFVAQTQDEIIEHATLAHLNDYYEPKEIDCEPPQGKFSCVAKCGLSGVLLGPPNVHSFSSTIKEVIRSKFPTMSESEYRSHIEMISDESVIEEWRASAVKKTVYVLKGAGEEAAQLTREQAEAEFKRTVLTSLLDAPKTLMLTADLAMKCPSLARVVRNALEEERYLPKNMLFALRGAFHHRKINFFRANDARGPEFVTNVVYKEFDAEHAIEELAKMAKFIAENPCQPKAVIAPDSESEKHLAWLVSTGHVVSFTNGVYSAVEKHPKYGPQWQKKVKAATPAAPIEETKSEETKELETLEGNKDEATTQLAE